MKNAKKSKKIKIDYRITMIKEKKLNYIIK